MWPLLIGAAIVGYFLLSSSSTTAIATLTRKPKVGETITVAAKEVSSDGKISGNWGNVSVKVREVTDTMKKTVAGEGKIAAGVVLSGPNAGKDVLIVYRETSTGPSATTSPVVKSPGSSSSGSSGSTATSQKMLDECRTADAPQPLVAYQRALITAGFLESISSKTGKTNADNACGPTTRQAVRDFQKSKGLSESGIIDKATADALAPMTTGMTTRARKTYNIIRPTDWGYSGPFSPDVFLIVPSNATEGPDFSAKISAERESDGSYTVLSVIENPGKIDVQPGDSGVYYRLASPGNWVLA